MGADEDRLATAVAARDVGDMATARSELRSLALEEDLLRRWIAGARLLPSLRTDHGDPMPITLLGTSTLDQTARAIELAGVIADLDLEVKTPSYGQYEAAVLDPTSTVLAPPPAAVVLLPDLRARTLAVWNPDPHAVVEEWVRSARGLWDAIRDQAPDTRILQANLVPPPGQPVGTLQHIDARGRERVVGAINDRLADHAGDGVAIVDLAGLAAQVGLEHWHDDRYWFHAKQAVGLSLVPRLAREVVKVLAASMGRSRKVIVTDLDGTLWGGIVGEDGVAGLRLGGDAVGEAHLALQQHLRDLRQRGIVLAVCSKNDEEVARRPFIERGDMVLRLDDFSAFMANWEPKSDNLRRIALDLDVGLDALVFLDDNPAERQQVRGGAPAVDVVELPAEPDGYVAALDRYPLLDTLVVTDEDAARTDQYRARAQAKALERQARTVEDYLTGLDMRAEIRTVDAVTLPRVVQLLGKTNQWNLTTRRHDAATVERMVSDPTFVVLAARLEDRFGDHGLIAVAIVRLEGKQAIVDTLLMSCRVIGRRLERSLLAELAEVAAQRGAQEIVGEYLPTERNGLVAELYPSLGFAQTDPSPKGERWLLSVEDARELATPFIQVGRASPPPSRRSAD